MLMVVGGFGWSDGLLGTPIPTRVELVSLDSANSPVPECLTDLSKTPSRTHAAAGSAMQDGIPLICDGSSNECRKYSPSDDSWTNQGPLPTQRLYAATGYMEQLGLIMAGGQEQSPPTYWNELYTTFDGIEFSELEPMPYKLSGACLVPTDDDTFYVMGGMTDENGAYEFLTHMLKYSISSNSWTEMSPMPVPRGMFFCGGLTDTETGTVNEIVMAGGYQDSLLVSTAYVYNVGEDSWTQVGDSPLFGWADNVPYGETFLAVGGNQLTGDTGPETQLTTIYIFNKADYTWELLDERLTYAREAPAAFLVSRSIFPECA